MYKQQKFRFKNSFGISHVLSQTNHFGIKGLDSPSLMSTNKHKTTIRLLYDSTQPEHTSTNFRVRFLFPL